MFVVSTACAGFALGSDEEIDWQKMAWTAVGTFGASAAANTLNQVGIQPGRLVSLTEPCTASTPAAWQPALRLTRCALHGCAFHSTQQVYEVNQDRLMKRTQRRPLPSGLLTRRHALAFAAVSAAAGVSALYAHTNGTTALLGAANIVLYAGVYTPLKQISVANTWVGAVVGAVPPLMGCVPSSPWKVPFFLLFSLFCFSFPPPCFFACRRRSLQRPFGTTPQENTTKQTPHAPATAHHALHTPSHPLSRRTAAGPPPRAASTRGPASSRRSSTSGSCRTSWRSRTCTGRTTPPEGADIRDILSGQREGRLS